MSFVYANLHDAVHDKHNTDQDKTSGNMLTHTILITCDLMISVIDVKGEKSKSLSSFMLKNNSEVF